MLVLEISVARNITGETLYCRIAATPCRKVSSRQVLPLQSSPRPDLLGSIMNLECCRRVVSWVLHALLCSRRTAF